MIEAGEEFCYGFVTFSTREAFCYVQLQHQAENRYEFMRMRGLASARCTASCVPSKRSRQL